jgi:flagellar basal-body rod protein FlgG
MIESLYIAETGMTTQQKLIDVISNNIANASTPGFKKAQLNFVDLVYQSGQVSNGDPNQISAFANQGAGVTISSNIRDFSVGELKQTGNPFDIAIQGAGFIEVELDNNEFGYSRAGRLRLDNDGYLTTSEGYKLSANIQFPPDARDLVVSSSGQISVRLGDDSDRTVIGEIELAKFASAEGLSSIGNNVYASTNDSGEAIYGVPGESGTGSLLQGHTEVSNVSMTEEMVNLMLAQRGYQLNARIIQISDQLLDTVNNLRR